MTVVDILLLALKQGMEKVQMKKSCTYQITLSYLYVSKKLLFSDQVKGPVPKCMADFLFYFASKALGSQVTSF